MTLTNNTFKDLDQLKQLEVLKETKLIAVLRAPSVTETIDKGNVLIDSGDKVS
ncbi:hypothetical protein [Pseudalkalibacillus decolorationis]|uniref:hypothetical protein n=1 Tax=Pseudalkalibacillus decolorationis TaxID=163879 RepID=UPI0021473192|nr:hypothetical protein [Pseudalkalibacillus decolorationis]